MPDTEKRAPTGLGSALEGFVVATSKPSKPTKEAMAEIGEGLGFRHTSEASAKKGIKRTRRPRVQKMQLNHSVSVDAVELFERVSEKNPHLKKGALLEMAIQLLADSQSVQ
jgi:hypothetical protein